MIAQTFEGFVLTRHWRDTPEGIELEFWFSSAAGPLCARVRGERSVFFLPADKVGQAKAILGTQQALETAPVGLQNFVMEPVVACYFSQHRAARRAADRLRMAGLDPLEADINPADRYLMERFVSGSAQLHGSVRRRGRFLLLDNPAIKAGDFLPSLTVVSFDIETAMEELDLYSIAVHGRSLQGEERRVFMCGPGADQDYVTNCADQDALLQAFLHWIADFDPDVLIGWNVVNFDTRFLQRLADRLGQRLCLGRDNRTGIWRSLDEDGERYVVQFPGRVFLDGIEMLRAAFYRFESFSLEHVSRQLLGEGKLLHGSGRGMEISRLFQEDKPGLARYNLKDCELVSEIFAATDLLDFALARARMTGLNMDRMGGSVASFDNLYLPRLHRAGYVAPNVSCEVIHSPGGFVLDSLPGLYEHVLVLDFKSLYPSIIRTFCIDPLGLALGLSGDPKDARTVEGYLDARFAREGHILPELIAQLWQQRDAAKVRGDEPLSQAIKIIMNSFYGVLGSPGCRFFNPQLASSITRRGHQILGRTRDYIEATGHQVIYGDTDSVFVWLQEAHSDAVAEAAGRQLEHDLNAWWREEIRREFALDSALELQFETHYKRFLMPTVRGSDKGSKKRYAGLVAGDQGDRLVFKGLESVRTDWTRLARAFQEELYRRIFLQEDYVDYVQDMTARVLAGEKDELLVYRKRLRRRLGDYERNVPPHVQAARLCARRSLPVPSRGAWVEYVITTHGPEPAARPLAPLDYQHYVDRQLAPVADAILGFVGSSFRALTDRQIGLF
ncbi:MAG: DNA polymerase II [Halioglobus sp.]|nr:DNA polymerase II [Halioglobus sp.]